MTVGPSVNGRVFDPGTQRNQIEFAPPKDAEPSRVLNDALLQAALDLGRREKARRRVIFIVSDGRESGSRASYKDVLKVAAHQQRERVRRGNRCCGHSGATTSWQRFACRRQGYNNVLPKYASATGGEIFREFTKQALGVRLRQRDGRGTKPVHAGVQHARQRRPRPTAGSRFGSAATVRA